uniref:Uncharacterized protein n=1 Tax=Arundo donax TaxID=35708 RepID=A0A0A9HEG5_ARUDO
MPKAMPAPIWTSSSFLLFFSVLVLHQHQQNRR